MKNKQAASSFLISVRLGNLAFLVKQRPSMFKFGLIWSSVCKQLLQIGVNLICSSSGNVDEKFTQSLT